MSKKEFKPNGYSALPLAADKPKPKPERQTLLGKLISWYLMS